MASVSAARLLSATRRILPEDLEHATLDGLRGLVEQELSLGADALLPRKKEFKKIVKAIFAEDALARARAASEGSTDGSDDRDRAADDASPAPRKKGRRKKAAAHKAAAGAAQGNQKKRALSSYMIWLKEEGRVAAKAAHPDASVTDIARHAGELWRELSDSDKEAYKTKAATRRQALSDNTSVNAGNGGPRGRSHKKRSQPAATTAAATITPGLTALSKLVRAAGVGPAVWKGLPSAVRSQVPVEKAEDPRRRQQELRRRLVSEHGVKIAGAAPTKAEIDAARQKHELAVALDGLDKSNILSPGRSRRSRRSNVSYRYGEDEASESADEDSSDGYVVEDSSPAPSKTARRTNGSKTKGLKKPADKPPRGAAAAAADAADASDESEEEEAFEF